MLKTPLFFLMLFSALPLFSQGGITSTAIDSAGNVLSVKNYDDLNVLYKSKGKHKLYAMADGKVIDRFVILEITRNEELVSMVLCCETRNNVLVRHTYFLKENKREVCLNRRYKFVETGSGLSYRLSKRLKPAKVSLSDDKEYPPDYW